MGAQIYKSNLAFWKIFFFCSVASSAKAVNLSNSLFYSPPSTNYLSFSQTTNMPQIIQMKHKFLFHTLSIGRFLFHPLERCKFTFIVNIFLFHTVASPKFCLKRFRFSVHLQNMNWKPVCSYCNFSILTLFSIRQSAPTCC